MIFMPTMSATIQFIISFIAAEKGKSKIHSYSFVEQFL